MKSIIIRVSVSLILLAIIIYKFNFKNIIYLNIFYFLPIIFLSFLMTMLRVLRWKILLKTVDYNLKFSSAVQIYLVGIFYGLMTPGKIGELGKAYFFSERLKVLEISIFEKILDIVILSFLSTIPLFIHLKLPESKELVSYVLVVVLILVTIFFAYLKVKNFRSIFLFILKFFKITEKIDEANTIKFEKTIFGKVLALSACYYLLFYLSTFFVLLLLSISYMELMLWCPLIILIGNLPITISGLGLREYFGGTVFYLFGIDPSLGVLFGFLLFVFHTLIPGFLGYAIMLKEGRLKWQIK